MLDPELLRTEFLGLAVRFDDIELDLADAATLFGAVAAHYGFNRLDYLADGGVAFAGPDGADFALRPGGAASGGAIRLGVSEGIERVAGVLGEATQRYAIGELWIEDVTLVASWAMQGDDAARRLVAEDVLRFDAERLGMIGDEETSVGLRVWRAMGDGNVDISIEPMHADPTRLYLRVAYSQPDSVADVSGLVAAIEALNDFLQGPVKSFLLGLARSSG